MTRVDFAEITKGRPHLKVTWEETTWWKKWRDMRKQSDTLEDRSEYMTANDRDMLTNRWESKILRRTKKMLRYIYCRIPARKRGGVRGRLLSLKKRVKAYLFSSQLFLETWETGDAVFLNLRLTFLLVWSQTYVALSICPPSQLLSVSFETLWWSVCENGTCDKWSEMQSVVSHSVIRGVIQWSDAQINVIWLSEGWEGGTQAWEGGRERDR